ncbi:hypothetical protein JVX91_22585 [Pseudomonas sp. PDNC002]|uniref:hypothetical protein n=1 Tax=Pseudomonas sp. PDNC002 TaxID=2811422 RepID=UPI001965B47A|nr:hypothetical protein [Pseudomonas sp. PDNC002]QRY78348.1 hypothetical protein JVX91_22585 [Pseudomonas sp. PDNC002]
MLTIRFACLASALSLAAATLLSGCGNLANVKSYSTPYSAPQGGETARLRVITNGMARGVPGSACIDWRHPGAGVIAVAQSGFANRNGQNLGMPPSRQAEQLQQGDFVSSEVAIPANQPFAFNFQSQGMVSGGYAYSCQQSMTFTPEAGEDYELTLIESGQCFARLQRLGDGRNLSGSLQDTSLCKATDGF